MVRLEAHATYDYTSKARTHLLFPGFQCLVPFNEKSDVELVDLQLNRNNKRNWDRGCEAPRTFWEALVSSVDLLLTSYSHNLSSPSLLNFSFCKMGMESGGGRLESF